MSLVKEVLSFVSDLLLSISGMMLAVVLFAVNPGVALATALLGVLGLLAYYRSLEETNERPES